MLAAVNDTSMTDGLHGPAARMFASLLRPDITIMPPERQPAFVRMDSGIPVSEHLAVIGIVQSFLWLQDALAVATARGLPVYVLNLHTLLILMCLPMASVGEQDVKYFLMGMPVAIGGNELSQWVHQTAAEASCAGVPMGRIDISCLSRFTRRTHVMGTNIQEGCHVQIMERDNIVISSATETVCWCASYHSICSSSSVVRF
jgi:hypothetical protein